MLFKDFLQTSAREIDFELERFFINWRKDVGRISLRLLSFVDNLADACGGGKRIRGALVKLGYELGNGEGEMREVLKAASAVEIFQTAILCHDDIIDKSMLRRGRESLYVRLGGDHTGISKAICLGDIGCFMAFQIMAKIDFSEKAKSRAIEIFSKMMFETGIGELMDVEMAGNDASVQEIITIYKYKTAFYTISDPLMIGAVLGGVGEEQIQAMRIFGQNLGIAFQIRDDINDIFGEREKLGKDPGGDIKEGKQTLLYLYAREHATAEQKDILNKYFGNSETGEREIDVVREVFKMSGALEYAQRQAEEYAAKGREAITGISKDAGKREVFMEMTEYFLR